MVRMVALLCQYTKQPYLSSVVLINRMTMNTPNSPAPGEKAPSEGETGDPKVNAAEHDVITNSDDTEKATNKDGAVADQEAITEKLSESEPTTELNTDTQITNNDSAATNELEPDEQF